MKTTKYNNLMFIPLIAFIAIWGVNCGKDKKSSNPNDDNGIVHLDIRGDCLDVLSSARTDSGYMVLEVEGNDLHIHHMDAYYNCCIEYAVNYQIGNFDIIARESDVANTPCLCDCFFNLKSTLFDLPGGLYTVTLIGIGGGTVGTDTVTVGG